MNKEFILCKHCGSEIPKKANVCPFCRKKQSTNEVAIILSVIVGGVIIFIICILAMWNRIKENVTREDFGYAINITDKELC